MMINNHKANNYLVIIAIGLVCSVSFCASMDGMDSEEPSNTKKRKLKLVFNANKKFKPDYQSMFEEAVVANEALLLEPLLVNHRQEIDIDKPINRTITTWCNAEHTPLMIAVFAENLAMVQLLLDSGAQVNSCTNCSYHSPFFAALNGSHKGVYILNQLLPYNPQVYFLTHLHVLSLHAKDLPVLKEAIKANKNSINEPDCYHGNTPLLNALFNYNQNATSLLLDNGAKIHVRNYLGISPYALNTLRPPERQDQTINSVAAIYDWIEKSDE